MTKRAFTLSSIELGSISDRSRFALRKLLFTVVYKIDLMQTREVGDLMQIDLSVRFEKLLFTVVYKIISDSLR